MKRPVTVLLAALALVLAGLIPAPAHAADVTPSFSCVERDRFTWTPVQFFGADDCYTTPSATLIMQGDGNFVVYYNDGRICDSRTHGHPGAYATFQDDGNLVIYYYGYVLWSSRTHGNPNSRLIFRGDGTLLIRNQFGQEIWRFC